MFGLSGLQRRYFGQPNSSSTDAGNGEHTSEQLERATSSVEFINRIAHTPKLANETKNRQNPVWRSPRAKRQKIESPPQSQLKSTKLRQPPKPRARPTRALRSNDLFQVEDEVDHNLIRTIEQRKKGRPNKGQRVVIQEPYPEENVTIRVEAKHPLGHGKEPINSSSEVRSDEVAGDVDVGSSPAQRTRSKGIQRSDGMSGDPNIVSSPAQHTRSRKGDLPITNGYRDASPGNINVTTRSKANDKNSSTGRKPNDAHASVQVVVKEPATEQQGTRQPGMGSRSKPRKSTEKPTVENRVKTTNRGQRRNVSDASVQEEGAPKYVGSANEESNGGPATDKVGEVDNSEHSTIQSEKDEDYERSEDNGGEEEEEDEDDEGNEGEADSTARTSSRRPGSTRTKLDMGRYTAAISLLDGMNYWEAFRKALETVKGDLRSQGKSRSAPRRVDNLLNIISDMQAACNTRQLIEDPNSEKAVRHDDMISKQLQDLEHLVPQLKRVSKPDDEKHEKKQKQLLTHIYLYIIPGLGQLLCFHVAARYNVEGWGMLSLREITSIMSMIVALGDRARDWQPRPKLSGIIKPTTTIKVNIRNLFKIFNKKFKASEKRLAEIRLKKQRREADVEARRRREQEAEDNRRKCAKRWEEIRADLNRKDSHQGWNRSVQSSSLGNDELVNLSPIHLPEHQTPATPDPPTRRYAGSPELGDDDFLPRTPLTVRSRHDELVKARLDEQWVKPSGPPEWTLEEDGALVNGLQEFRGKSRYFDIFSAYSGNELRMRDMDAIEKRARVLKITLSMDPEIGGSVDFDFLWSVED